MQPNPIIGKKILLILFFLFLIIKIVGQSKESLVSINFNFNRYYVCDLEGNFEIYFFSIDSINNYSMYKPIIIGNKITIEDNFYKKKLQYIIFKYKNNILIFDKVPNSLKDVSSFSFTLGLRKYILKGNEIYIKGNEIYNIDNQYIYICNPDIKIENLSMRENKRINRERRNEIIRKEKRDFKRREAYICICYSGKCIEYTFKNSNFFFEYEYYFFEKLKELDGTKKNNYNGSPK